MNARLTRIDERDNKDPSDLLPVPNAPFFNTPNAWQWHYACRPILEFTKGSQPPPPCCHPPTPTPPLATQPQVYFVVALFRAAQPSVMEAASKGLDLTGLLGRGEALEAFNLEESLSFMEALERRHRGRCIAATKAYLAQC